MPRRSLSLRLINGNILNAVKFKLLLPETRNNLHEILGSLLMKNVGFIVPETFQVKTNINGSEAIMLFQEDATKEILERNRRREGPIFEGDENILWSYKNYENFFLKKLSLARLINKKWFLKGKSAEFVSLNSFIKIQKAFVEYSQNMVINKQLIIFPNNLANNSFQEYFLTLLAMNGAHGLRPHNRRFFFNSLSNFFEPIYYDGDLALDKKGVEFSGHFKIDNDLLKNAFNENFFKNYVNPFINLYNSKKIIAEFQNRVLVPEHIAKNFYNKALFNVNHNMNELLSRIKSQVSKQVIFSNYTSNRKAYLKKHQLHKIDQTLISSLVSEKFNYTAKTENGYKLDLTAENVAEIISKNKFKNKRTVFLPFPSKYHDNNINQLRLPETKEGKLFFLIV